ncbi:GtrA family protein [Teredinibacter purpureus]|uniref:GtrA family protein n=1 Tax=Teredinibacter purpureus TaxID=2731756 RepID=UPI000B2A7A32|nr:GtrA family protein [Teredinibacter purpureus]
MPITFIRRTFSRELIVQLLVFGVVGVLATLTHYLVALFSYEGLNLSLYFANLLGYLSAVLVSYFGHGRFTFKQSFRWALFVRFSVMSVTTFLCSELMLVGLENYAQLPARFSLAVVVCTIPIVTFVLSKLWVFKP